MKKKQLAKLQQQFQPSFKTTQVKVLHSMEKKVYKRHGFKVEAFIQAEYPDELVIRRLDLDEKAKDKEINVPLDENFTGVIKRIQNGEKELGELFSDNLAQEIAGFWTSSQTQTSSETVQKNEAVHANDSNVKETMTFVTFKEKIEAYPNFYVEITNDYYEIKEQTKDKPRLLATISSKVKNEYTIESALNRKYKLKLEIIPLIETFAYTPLDAR